MKLNWLLNDNFIDIVKSVWSTFIKGSFAFQFARKTNLFNKEIIRSHIQDKHNCVTTWKLFQDLGKIQFQLMKWEGHPTLWMQERKLHEE